MIFNFGENPTMDVIRMLMHYAALQQKKAKEQETNQIKRKTLLKNEFASNVAAFSPHPTLPPTVILPAPANALSTKTSVVSPPSARTTTSTTAAVDGLRRLHVTNLPFKIRDNELKYLFAVHGKVLEAEIIYNERGSKGFGFVTMETAEGANKAKEALHGKEIEGRKIEVNKATPRSNTAKATTSRVRNKSSIVTATVTTAIQPPVSHLNGGLRNVALPPAPTFPPGWTASSLNCMTQTPVPTGYQLPHSPHQQLLNTFSAAPMTNGTAGIPSIPYYPTPEQYAQYYAYLTAQTGPVRAGNNASGFRFQPY